MVLTALVTATIVKHCSQHHQPKPFSSAPASRAGIFEQIFTVSRTPASCRGSGAQTIHQSSELLWHGTFPQVRAQGGPAMKSSSCLHSGKRDMHPVGNTPPTVDKARIDSTALQLVTCGRIVGKQRQLSSFCGKKLCVFVIGSDFLGGWNFCTEAAFFWLQMKCLRADSVVGVSQNCVRHLGCSDCFDWQDIVQLNSPWLHSFLWNHTFNCGLGATCKTACHICVAWKHDCDSDEASRQDPFFPSSWVALCHPVSPQFSQKHFLFKNGWHVPFADLKSKLSLKMRRESPVLPNCWQR